MLVAAVIILAGVVVVASGRGGEMAPEYPDYPRIDLGPVTAADVVMMRPPTAAWGYNMRITDEALEAIARAVTERDVRISALEQEVSDLRGQAGEHPLGAQPAIPGPASGPASGEDTAPAWPLRDGTAAGEPGPEWAPYGAAVPGLASPYGAPAHEESPYETAGYADAGPGEPAYEAAAHGQPPHETVSYADATHEEPAHQEAGQDPAWGTSQHAPSAAPAQPSVWEPAGPYEQADGDDVDDRGSGPVTDPDLPRVPADAADLSGPASFWDVAAPPPPGRIPRLRGRTGRHVGRAAPADPGLGCGAPARKGHPHPGAGRGGTGRGPPGRGKPGRAKPGRGKPGRPRPSGRRGSAAAGRQRAGP